MPVIKKTGFTLVELVVGIIVFSIALVLFTSLIVPQAIRSVDPVFQVRAAELGQSIINEITGKSFDEASDRTGSGILCSATLAPICTASNNLGAEEGANNRASFDDIDDYNDFNLPDIDGKFTNSLQGDITQLYAGFSATVSVVYDADMNGADDSAIGNVKLITVTVTTPNDENIIFSTFRSNY